MYPNGQNFWTESCCPAHFAKRVVNERQLVLHLSLLSNSYSHVLVIINHLDLDVLAYCSS